VSDSVAPSPAQQTTTAEAQRFRAMVESSPMGMHFYRLEPGGRLIFVGANPAADRLLGVDNHQFIGLTIEEAFPPLAATEVPRRYREVAESGTHWSTEQIEYRDDRIIGAFEVNAFRTAPGEMVATFLEITRRKQAEEALRQSEEKYRLVVENQNDLVLKLDPRGRILFASDAYCRAFGKAERELLGTDGMAQVLEEDRGVVAGALANLLGPPWTNYVEHRSSTVKGVRWFAWSSRSIRDATGGVVAIVGTGRDVTERRALEEQLRQAEKLQAIGQIAGGVAHDFNNQLTGILGNASLLAESLQDRPELAALAGEIREGAMRSARLTSQLLAFARKGAVQAVPIDLHQVIADVQTLLRRAIDKRIVLRAELGARLATVIGDPAQLNNALLNLALNARDAMPEGGELRFATRTVELSPSRRAALQLEPGAEPLVELSVGDTGTGMDAATRARIFEPFFTTKPQGKGVGLGLPAVYGTVKAHRGAIDLRSEPGKGTTFTVWLPAVLARAPGAPEKPAEPARRRARVLVIDDEPLVRSSAERMLRSLGHEVISAGLGAEGLALFERERARLDLVILDMVMPDLSGPEVFSRILAVDPAARVILSSGNALDGVEREVLRGRRGWALQKPYTPDDLSRVIREALG
jgi:PAS domain S-box-containing protein